jgi:UDP-2,4-diacetamido-2,4,6-trideoxy-beta-L-altropyranose hydrolase
LAEELRSRGVFVSFVCRAHEGNLISLIRERTFLAVALPIAERTLIRSDKEHEPSLGESQELDAEQTITALRGEVPDWLIIDHYAIDSRWEQRVRPHAGQLMVIDDRADRSHDCDMLLDQNYAVNGAERYRGRVPDTSSLITSPRYALLARNYSAFARIMQLRDGPVRRVFVFFGGSDPENMTVVAIEALSSEALRELEVDVVVGPNNRHRKLIETVARQRKRTTVHNPKRDLVGLMGQADLAIGAGGVTTWERMCIGLPAVVVSIADNQRPACEALGRSDLIHYAGPSDGINATDLARIVESIIEDPEDLFELRVRNRQLVDGFGAGRVAEMMFPSRDTQLELVSVPSLAVNNQNSRDKTSSSSDDISLEVNGVPTGRLRYEKKNERILVEWSIDQDVAQNKWDAILLGRGLKMIQSALPSELGKPSMSPFFTKRSDAKRRSDASENGLSLAILSDAASWMNEYIPGLLVDWLNSGYAVLWVHDKEDLRGADFCFMLGCGQIVPESELAQFRNCLVVHESDLPEGKGWSPLTWQILEGKHRVPVTLLEAAGKVDSGAIYAQEWLTFRGGELIDEMRAAVANSAIELCKRFVREYPEIEKRAHQQTGTETYYRRRTPEDSRLQVNATIESQFDLLRVVDNQRYPAFFEARGHRYVLGIRRETKL